MGSQKDKFRAFAVAFWKTSAQDLERAEDAFKEGYYCQDTLVIRHNIWIISRQPYPS